MGLSAGLVVAPIIGTAIAGGAVYAKNQSDSQKRAINSLQSQAATTTPPPPAAKPATLAQATAATKAKAGGAASGPKPATAGGTVGASGPEGLITPPQTANLTLLGGTK